MIPRPHIDWFALAPVNSLLAASALALLCAVLAPARSRKAVTATLSALGYATALGFAVALYVKSAHGHGVVVDAFRRDRLAELTAIIVAGSGILAAGVSYRERWREDHIGEYYALLAAAGGGMVFFVGANNLLTLFLALEWFSICLYILCAIDRDRLSGLEAALKYLIIGGFGSAVLLFGAALVYGATGAIDFPGIAAAGQAHDALLLFGLAMIIAGLAFKASAAPFHMWTPDVYEGAPTPVTAFFSVAPKIAAIALFVRFLVEPFGGLLVEWRQVIVFLSVASMVLGAVAAIAQTNIKRLMAYSSIGHVGYALIGLAAATPAGIRGVLVYMAIYLFMNLGTWAVILCMRQQGQMLEGIADLSGLGRTQPGLALALGIFMFALAGIPPTAGFFGKLYVFLAAIDAHLIGLAVIGVVTSVVGAFYYLRIVKVMYFDEPAAPFEPMPGLLKAILGVSGLLVLLLGIVPGPLIAAAETAAKSLF